MGFWYELRLAWDALWPNMFAISFWTSALFLWHHRSLKKHINTQLAAHHADLKAHITAATAPPEGK